MLALISFIYIVIGPFVILAWSYATLIVFLSHYGFVFSLNEAFYLDILSFFERCMCRNDFQLYNSSTSDALLEFPGGKIIP